MKALETLLVRAAEPRPTLAMVLAVVDRAVTSKNGVEWERLRADGSSTHVLAVVHDAGVTVGIGHARGSKLLEAAWPSLAGWNRDDNSALALRWALESADDRVTLQVPRSDAPDFLAAIRAAPDDDQPRLIYADWLMERGDAHGELISLQLQKTPLSRHAQHRLTTILDSEAERIAGELAPFIDQPAFHRGFVERVRMTPGEFTHEGERLFAKYPLKTWLVAGEDLSPREVKTIAAAPGLSRVQRLEVMYRDLHTSRVPLAPLAKGRFTSLETLSFEQCGHSGDDWFALFSKLDAPELRHVEFIKSYSHPLLLLGLATNPKLTKLSNIDDWATELGDDARDTFAAAMRAFADQRPSLKSLILSRSAAHDDESLHPLFASSSCVELETFDIDGAGLSDESLRAWQRGGKLGQLKSLSIRDAHFTPKAVAEFIDAGVPPKLERLVITTWDELRWSTDDFADVFEALLAVPTKAALKDVHLPPGGRGNYRLLDRLSRRFKVTA